MGFQSVDESVPQARQGQGQGLFLYRLQPNAAEFIKKKSVDSRGQEGINTSCLFHSRYSREKKSPESNMEIPGSMALLLLENVGRRRFILIS